MSGSIIWESEMLVEIQLDSDAKPVVLGATSSAPDGIKIQLTNTRSLRDGGATLLVFALMFGKGIAAGTAAAWLYDWLKGRASNVRIDGRSVPITQSALKAAVESTGDI